jgi:P27 family predicted phage terminase small subunit
MTRGRKPLPTVLKLVRGNPGKRPLNDAEPVPTRDLTEQHKEIARLTPRQRELLRDLLGDLPKGLLKSVDLPLVVVFVHSWERYLDCIAHISKETLIVKANNEGAGYKQNPFIKLSRYFADDMMRAATEIGCTPAARARLRVGSKKNGEDDGDPFSDLAAEKW